eukprot:TRINITY_DN27637_c0_g1_i1.p1 TRINITY_DN27637_c0_g1~~TRINITY_DN27637_c0_g1_i1.p1  ORF type:complete len:206 (+),score=32.15 TRINITY_DN27637_c0_g1_i1:60-677(+)
MLPMQKESDRIGTNIMNIVTGVMTADEIARKYEMNFGVSLRNEMRKCGYGNMREVFEGMAGLERIGGGPNPSFRRLDCGIGECTPSRSSRVPENPRVSLIRRASTAPDYTKLLSNCIYFSRLPSHSEFIVPVDLQLHSRDDPVLVSLPVTFPSVSMITAALSQQGVEFRIQGSSSPSTMDVCTLFVSSDAVDVVDQLQNTPMRRC